MLVVNRGGNQFGGSNFKPVVGGTNQGGIKNGNGVGTSKNTTLEQRRQLGLCFKCGEKYGPGHQCRRLILNMEASDDEEVEEDTEEEPHAEEEQEDDGGQISFHALKEGPTGKIIQVKG